MGRCEVMHSFSCRGDSCEEDLQHFMSWQLERQTTLINTGPPSTCLLLYLSCIGDACCVVELCRILASRHLDTVLSAGLAALSARCRQPARNAPSFQFGHMHRSKCLRKFNERRYVLRRCWLRPGEWCVSCLCGQVRELHCLWTWILRQAQLCEGGVLCRACIVDSGAG